MQPPTNPEAVKDSCYFLMAERLNETLRQTIVFFGDQGLIIQPEDHELIT